MGTCMNPCMGRNLRRFFWPEPTSTAHEVMLQTTPQRRNIANMATKNITLTFLPLRWKHKFLGRRINCVDWKEAYESHWRQEVIRFPRSVLQNRQTREVHFVRSVYLKER
uniref:Uncharacterized protein n=1 Tax=Cacopsylla melanoneura TaxID=428564 RepID=A0A8D8R552_9HEMI